ncbi:MAG: cell division protein ZapA [Acidobacteriaceae bacterium]
MSETQQSANTAPAAAQPSAEPQSVSVSIYDQTYHLRGTDPDHIQQLAEIVDSKMRAVAAQGATVDSLRVAVLAALNIADELLTTREQQEQLAGSIGRTQSTLKSRADSLAGLLDAVLDERKAG